MTEFDPDRDSGAPVITLKSDVPPSYAPKRRASRLRRWGTAVVIAVGLLAVMYGITVHRVEVEDEQRHSQLRHDTPPAGLRGTLAPVSPAAQPGG